MSKSFTVNSYADKTDSLRESFKIAFTLTPVESKRATSVYNPWALLPTLFTPFGLNGVTLKWDSSSFTLDTCTVTNQVMKLGPLALSNLTSVLPRQTITLTSPITWSPPASYNDPEALEQASIIIVNRARSDQSIVVGLGPTSSRINVLTYQHVLNGHSVTVPSGFTLQVYVVSNTIESMNVLLPKDLTRPILPVPLRCDSLPESTTWTLCQDAQGVVTLKNEEYPELGSAPAPPLQSSEFTNKAILAQLSEILERLSTVEKSVRDNHDQLQDLKRRVPVIESQAKEAVARSESRVSVLEESTSRVRDQVATVEKAASRTQDELYVVRQLVVATHSQLSSMKPSSESVVAPEPAAPSQKKPTASDERAHAVESKVEKLEKSSQEQRRAVRLLDRRVDGKVDRLELDVVQASVADLNRRVSALEATSEGYGGGVGDLLSSSSIEGSPAMFPNHLTDDPTTA